MTRYLWILGGLFLALVGALIVLPPTNERQVPLTVYSAEPEGGKALRLWLESIGYTVATLEGDRYAIDRDVAVVLLLAPTQPLSSAAIGELDRWTRQGGRLVVATDGRLTRGLLRRFDISTEEMDSITQAVPAAAGRLDPELDVVRVETQVAVVLGEEAARAVPLLLGQRSEAGEPPADNGAAGVEAASAGAMADRARGREATAEAGVTGVARIANGGSTGTPQPIVAARVPADRGELIVLTAPAALSNASLADEANARLALSLIGPSGPGQVAFDELHHGFGMLEGRSMYSLLLEHAWGRTILLAGGMVALFLLWRGRRFGRAVPVFVDRGRSQGELVTSLAGLYRAGGKRAFVAEHLAQQLRQGLAQGFGLPADAPDDRIAAGARAIGRDATHALRILSQIRQARSDRELLALTREAERACAELTRGSQPG